MLAQTYECIHLRANISTRSLQERWRRRKQGKGTAGVEFLALIFVRQMTPRQIKPHRRQSAETPRGQRKRDGTRGKDILSPLDSARGRERGCISSCGTSRRGAAGGFSPLVHRSLAHLIVFPWIDPCNVVKNEGHSAVSTEKGNPLCTTIRFIFIGEDTSRDVGTRHGTNAKKRLRSTFRNGIRLVSY